MAEMLKNWCLSARRRIAWTELSDGSRVCPACGLTVLSRGALPHRAPR